MAVVAALRVRGSCGSSRRSFQFLSLLSTFHPAFPNIAPVHPLDRNTFSSFHILHLPILSDCRNLTHVRSWMQVLRRKCISFATSRLDCCDPVHPQEGGRLAVNRLWWRSKHQETHDSCYYGSGSHEVNRCRPPVLLRSFGMSTMGARTEMPRSWTGGGDEVHGTEYAIDPRRRRWTTTAILSTSMAQSTESALAKEVREAIDS